MKSAWIEGRENIQIKDIDVSPPVDDEVLVKIKACGICGTDLHFYHDYPQDSPMPIGHEVSGVVEEVGPLVKDLKKGDDVIVQNHVNCGKCLSCLNGEWENCLNIKTYMNDKAGMAEFLKVTRGMVVKFDNLTYIEAALAEPITVALDLLRRTEIKFFNNVLISGPGTIGLVFTRLAKLSGAKKVAVLGHARNTPRGKKRLQTALFLGADNIYDTDEGDWKEKIKRDFPDGFERIIVTSPPETIPDTFEFASFGGRIIYNGISFSDEDITFNANDFHFKKLSLIASHAIPNWGFPIAFDLMKQKVIDADELVTHILPFKDLIKAFKVASSIDDEVIKVVVTF